MGPESPDAIRLVKMQGTRPAFSYFDRTEGTFFGSHSEKNLSLMIIKDRFFSVSTASIKAAFRPVGLGGRLFPYNACKMESTLVKSITLGYQLDVKYVFLIVEDRVYNKHEQKARSYNK